MRYAVLQKNEQTPCPQQSRLPVVKEEQKEMSQIQSYYSIIGAAVMGPLHVINSTPCQDACAFEAYPSGFAVISVSDGLGSASKSEAGARIAVDAVVCCVKKTILDKKSEEVDLEILAKNSVGYARKALEEKAAEYQCNLRDMACTIIAIVMYKDTVAIAHIGDGAVITKIDGGLKLLSGPGESEYANEVSPLTGKDWEQSLRPSSMVSGISGIMVFTDGCQRAALRKTQDGLISFAGFCEPLFSYAKEVKHLKEGEEDIKNLLLSKKVCENSDDDKTLVIATLNKC